MGNPFSIASSFLMYFLFQIVFLRNLMLYDTAHCYIYVAFLLLLPISFSPILLMGIGFWVGLVIDAFYNTAGIHAAACVLIMFVRGYMLTWLKPSGGYEAIVFPNPFDLSFQWFLRYSLSLLTIHHLFIFWVEASDLMYFYLLLGKVVMSVFFTFILMNVFLFIRHHFSMRR